MKKTIHLISILIFIYLSTVSLFGEENLLSISSQSISISYYSESEYIKEYGSSVVFSNGFDISSETEDVTISVNGNNYEYDTLSLKNLVEGTYLISIKKSGYQTIKKWIKLEDNTRIVIEVTLERKIGYISINSEQKNLELYINDISISNNQAIPTGSYILKIKSFGYESQSQNITIIEGRTTSLIIELNNIAFKINKISSDKAKYNPSANEGFKTNRVKIEVNGPGTGILSLKDSDGITLLTKELTFTTWDTFFNLNQPLLDDKYSVTITVEEQSKTTYIDVDNSLFIKNIPIFRGLPGLVTTPTAESNPIPVSTTSFSLKTFINNGEISIPFSFQLVKNRYLSFRGGSDFLIDFNNNSSEIELFTGFKLNGNINPIYYALNVNYQFNGYQNDNIDDSYYHNIILNIPLSLKIYNLYFTISPEYLYNITSQSSLLGSGVGIHYDNQLWRYGLSGRFDKNENEYDYLFGAEIYRLLPGTQSYAGLVITSTEELDLSLMLNLSVLY